MTEPFLQWPGIEIFRVEEMRGPTSKAGVFMSAATQEQLATLGPDQYLPETDDFMMSSCLYVVKADGLVVLVDTGIGNGRDLKVPAFSGLDEPVLERLAEVGAGPDDVDVVVNTHMHLDHVGWNTNLVDGEWRATFPRARYLFNRIDLGFLLGPEGDVVVGRVGDYRTQAIEPVLRSELAEIYQPPHRISERLWIQDAIGDSPGHIVVVVEHEGRPVAYITGDVFHTVLQVRYPELIGGFSSTAREGVETRRRLFADASANGAYVLAGHVPVDRPMRIVRADDGYDVAFD